MGFKWHGREARETTAKPLRPLAGMAMPRGHTKAEAAAFAVWAEVLSGGIVRRARGVVEFWVALDFSGADKSYWGKVLDVSGHRRFCVVAR